MRSLPRLAIGTVQEGAELQAVLTALLDTLRRGGVQTQCFSFRASLHGPWTATAVTGVPGRHLDSWLMSREVCFDHLVRAAGGSDLAMVVGSFASRLGSQSDGGSLETLCDWFDLPRLAVVNDSLIDRHGLPGRPRADAVLLDHTSRDRSLAGMVTDIETLWGLPVVGALGNAPELRNMLGRLAPGDDVPPTLCDHLSEEFCPYWRPERFAEFADAAMPLDFGPAYPIHDLPACKPTVAVAYDEAFYEYFPSTLDQLELLGAQVVDFSPLHDEDLPPGTDIVYLGCGRPEAYARALSENHCMMSALRSHVACGGRVYGEVGGAAYLSQAMQTPSGEFYRMCGILPSLARFQSACPVPQPIEITVTRENWLAPQGARLRGYRSGRWRLEPLGCRLDANPRMCCQSDMLGCNRVVGSLIHFQFSALPDMLQRFFRPSSRSMAILDPWQIVS
ncbi:MAG: hypothetical protein ACYC6Y_05275 [Thermoguttaceae bacterium]